jgi:chromosome segregation ATPase
MSTKTTDDLIVMLARRARAARRKLREVEAYHRGLVREPDDKDEAIANVMSQRDAACAEASRLAQELEAARLAAQDADERAQARERQLVQSHDALNATERERDAARAETHARMEDARSMQRERDEMRRKLDAMTDQRDEARAALAEALTRVEARDEEIRRLGNRVEAAEQARERGTEALVEAYEKAERERANEMRAAVAEHEAELQRLRREVEIRDAGIEMGVALVRYLDAGVDIVCSGRTVFPTHTQGAVYEALQRARQAHDADEAARAAHPLARGGA